MNIKLIDEYNENGHLIYIENLIGAYVRGYTYEEAMNKLFHEIRQYISWLTDVQNNSEIIIDSVEHKYSSLNICDADSDVIFESEKHPLTADEYEYLKKIALKSSCDFLELYESIPDKHETVLSPRKTFYGNIPITAEEMYVHTKNVNSYYFNEIGVDAINEPDIFMCRSNGFSLLEKKVDFLDNKVKEGSYGEFWSLRKMMRRFIWHDRIHAKAMYRMAVKLCGKNKIKNPFHFEI